MEEFTYNFIDRIVEKLEQSDVIENFEFFRYCCFLNKGGYLFILFIVQD